MTQITNKIRQQHLNEKAQLAMELYQLEARREVVKKRLGEIDIIMATTQAVDAESTDQESADEDNTL